MDGGAGEEPQVADPGLRWLPLPVHGDLPLTVEELRRLVRLHARDSPEQGRRRGQAFPPEESVPDGDRVRTLADRVARSVEAARQLDPGVRDVLERPDAAAVLDAIREVRTRLGEVLRHRRSWAVKVADRALGDPRGETWERLADHGAAIERLLDLAPGLGDAVVEGVAPSEEALQAVTVLEAELASGQPARRRFRGRAQRAAARLLEDARVDGEPVVDAEAAAVVRRFLEYAVRAAALGQELAPLGVPVPEAEPADPAVEEWAAVRDALGSIARLVEASRRLVDVLGPGPAGLLAVGSVEDARGVGWVADALVEVREGEQAHRELETAARGLERSTARVMAQEGLDEAAPEVAELVLCLRAAAGPAYGEWLGRMQAGRRTRRLAVQREELVARVAAQAPGLPALLDADSTDATWAPRIARWAEAWEAARAVSEAVAPDPRAVILELVASGPVTGAEVRAATGLGPAQSRALLQELVDAGELVRTGATSATRWHRAGVAGER